MENARTKVESLTVISVKTVDTDLLITRDSRRNVAILKK
jgi:hypothetical protein